MYINKNTLKSIRLIQTNHIIFSLFRNVVTKINKGDINKMHSLLYYNKDRLQKLLLTIPSNTSSSKLDKSNLQLFFTNVFDFCVSELSQLKELKLYMYQYDHKIVKQILSSDFSKLTNLKVLHLIIMRTNNMRYKIPFPKLNSSLEVFRTNSIIDIDTIDKCDLRELTFGVTKKSNKMLQKVKSIIDNKLPKLDTFGMLNILNPTSSGNLDEDIRQNSYSDGLDDNKIFNFIIENTRVSNIVTNDYKLIGNFNSPTDIEKLGEVTFLAHLNYRFCNEIVYIYDSEHFNILNQVEHLKLKIEHHSFQEEIDNGYFTSIHPYY